MYYKPLYTYKLRKEDTDISVDFADKVNPLTYPIYKDRDPDLTIERAWSNHFESKISELAAVHFLKSLGMSSTDPDFTIHVKRKFDPDLLAESQTRTRKRPIKVHVKSQTEGLMKYCKDASYAFTTNDNLVIDPDLDDFLLLTLIYPNNTIDVVDFIPAINALPRFLKPMIKNPNNKKKKAIYYKDIRKAKEDGLFHF